MTLRQEADRSAPDADGGAVGPASVYQAAVSLWNPARHRLGSGLRSGRWEYGPATACPARRPRLRWSIRPPPRHRLLVRLSVLRL
ncbi:hypothetical protein [Streptomyces sp. cg2]